MSNNKVSTEDLLNKLTDAASFRYREDKTAPGITVARLKKGYYCSVIRYDGAFARDKQVVCSARGDNLPTTLKLLAKSFLTTVNHVKDPIQQLDQMIKSADVG